MDHIFSLKTLIDIYLNKHKRLYCCYVDYSKALDTVSRTELWSELLNNNISGKLFQIIHDMYKSAKSCVSVNSTLTDNFSCIIGVRQGDNLSPLVFSIFLNDFKLFLEPAHDGLKTVNTLSVENLNQELLVFCKLYILIYADDTVILAESQEDLQQSIDLMERYCSMWKLNINVSKTWPGEPPEDGEMIEMTLSSRHRIRNSSPGGLSTLPLVHAGSPLYWLLHVDGEETFLFLSSRRDREPNPEVWRERQRC